MKRLLFYLLLIIFTLGCTTSRHINSGDEMMSRSNYQRAAREYNAALRNSPNNAKAYAGLQNASDSFINQQLKIFDNQYNNRQYVEAANTMEGVQDFIKTYRGRGIETNVPGDYQEKYQAITNAAAEFHYLHGQQELARNNFNAAINHFEKSLEETPNYKNVTSLLKQAKKGARNQKAETFYQRGYKRFQAGNYRQAYRYFKESQEQVRGYKNAADFQRHALERGKVRVAFFDFTNNSRQHGAERTLYSYVLNNVVNNKSPFLDIVDRQNLYRLLDEINFSYSGNVDPATAARAGKMLGLNYVVIGEITNVIVENPEVRSQAMDAYELYYENVDGQQQPRGKPVRYMVHNETINITFEANYQVISVETGQIIKSNIVSSSAGDQVVYARYRGDTSLLYPTDPGEVVNREGFLGLVTTGLDAWLNRVNQELFAARSTLKSANELQTDILKDIGQNISREIIREFR